MKAKKSIAHRDLKGLLALKEETTFNKYIVVSLEDVERHVNGIQILPWDIFQKSPLAGRLLFVNRKRVEENMRVSYLHMGNTHLNIYYT